MKKNYIATVLALASISVAQLTPCTSRCYTNASIAAGCPSYTNLECVCRSPQFLASLTQCETNTCTPKELPAAINYLQTECKAFQQQMDASIAAQASTSSTPATPKPSSSAASRAATKATATKAVATATKSAAAKAKAGSKAEVIAIVVVTILGVVIIAAVGWLCYRHRKTRNKRESIDLVDDDQNGKYVEMDSNVVSTPYEYQRSVPTFVITDGDGTSYADPFASRSSIGHSPSATHSVDSHPSSPFTQAQIAMPVPSHPRDIKTPIPPSPPPPSSPSASSSTHHPMAVSNVISESEASLLTPNQLLVIERLVAQNMPPKQIAAVIDSMLAAGSQPTSTANQSSADPPPMYQVQQ